MKVIRHVFSCTLLCVQVCSWVGIGRVGVEIGCASAMISRASSNIVRASAFRFISYIPIQVSVRGQGSKGVCSKISHVWPSVAVAFTVAHTRVHRDGWEIGFEG
jgi:hypothetical protein